VVEAALSAGRIRFRLLVIWAALVVLVGLIVVLEQTGVGRVRGKGRSASDPRLLLPVSIEQLGAIEVIDAGTLHRFERDAAGVWFYHGIHGASESAHRHSADPSAAARIERAFAAFGRTRIERRVGRERDIAAYGVAPPKVVILLYTPGATQPLAQYAVGDVAPDTVSRYVDVVGGASGVVTIPNYQIDNLLALVDSVAGSSSRRASPDAATTSALPAPVPPTR
jgi:hypothetical protein